MPIIAFYSAPRDLLTPRTHEPIVVGETVTTRLTPSLCEAGLHASHRLEDADRWRPSGILTLVEIDGDICIGHDKICGRSRKTLHIFTEYNKVKNAARAEYDKAKDAAWAEYNKVKDAAWAEYNKVEDAAWAEYNKVEDAAWAEYKKVKDAAVADVKKLAREMGWEDPSQIGEQEPLS